jgi:hypothetical protein
LLIELLPGKVQIQTNMFTCVLRSPGSNRFRC